MRVKPDKTDLAILRAIERGPLRGAARVDVFTMEMRTFIPNSTIRGRLGYLEHAKLITADRSRVPIDWRITDAGRRALKEKVDA